MNIRNTTKSRRDDTLLTVGFNLRNIIIALLFCLSATAQIRHEYSIGGGGGLSTLNYSLTSPASAKKGLGGEVGAGYTLFFNPHWGVGTGAGVSFFNAKADAAGLQSLAPNLTNEYGDRYELRTTLDRFSEKQNATFVNIPLFLRYVHGSGFYAQAGAKFYIPVAGTYSVSDAAITNKGYFPDFGTEVSGPAFSGFGTFSGYHTEDDLKLKTAVAASVEAGWQWRLSGNLSLYTGIYLDYGLNDVRKETGNTFVIPNVATPEDFSTSSLLASQDTQGKDFSGKASPLAAGITVRLAFGKASGKSAVTPSGETRHDYNDYIQKSDEEIAEQRRKSEEYAAQRERQAAARADSLRQIAEVRKAEETRKAEEQRQYAAAVTELQRPASDFEVGQTAPSLDVRADLFKKATQMKKYPDMKILIEGHTCNTGTHAVNVRVGQQRADAAKAYLVKQGIAADRIQTISKAETEPIAPNDSEENRRKNRRVEVKVIQ
jgi:outer membrane protein OmpA-like peptidoglycan-associated protein